VEVHGEDAIPAQRERRVTPRPIGVCARDDRGCDEQAGDRAGYHGTIRPTLIGTPQRRQVVAAKTAVNLVTGFLVGALASGAVAAAGTLFLRARGIEVHLAGADYWELVTGGAVAAALWSVIGLGVGTVVRSQVPSIVALFVWVLFVENILLASFPEIGRFAPGALARTMAGQTSGTLDSAVLAALLLAGYALATIAAGALTTTRRDFA